MRGRTLFWLSVLAALIALLSLSAACGDDDDDDDNDSGGGDDDSGDDDEEPDVGELIDDGRFWLRAGEFDRARLAFGEAVDLAPNNAEAHYGAMLAGTLKTFSLISLATALLAPDGHDVDKADDPNRDLIDRIVEIITDVTIRPAAEEGWEHGAWLQERGDPPFEIDSIPVHLFLEVAAKLETEFDGGERAGCQAFSAVFLGVSKILGGLNLDFDLGYVFTLMDVDFGDYEALEIGAIVVDLIDRLLNDPGYPLFLSIEADRLDDFKSAQIDLGLGFLKWREMLNLIREETDPQDDDVIGYFDANENGAYDEGEPYVLPAVGTLDEDGMEMFDALAMLFDGAAAALLDRTAYDLHPGEADGFDLALLNPLLSLFDFPPIIPAGFAEVDLARVFENADVNSLRDFLQGIVNTLAPLLPEPPDVF